jgi:[ribosomal protein S5]-alanine N-acetyltransferase
VILKREDGPPSSRFSLSVAMIETERLLLTPLIDGDAEAIATKINNYDIAKNLARVPHPYTLHDAHEFLRWTKTLDQRSCFMTLRLKSSPDELIGCISYDWVEDKQQSELGYWMVQGHWGKGLMSEAARAMVEHAFTVSALSKLSSCFFNDNPASGKVLAKAGFQPAGPCTHFSKAQNRDVPVTLMRLTREQWSQQQSSRQTPG